MIALPKMAIHRALVVASVVALIGCSDDSVGASGDAGGSGSTGAGTTTAPTMVEPVSSSSSEGSTTGSETGTTAAGTTGGTTDGSSTAAGSDTGAETTGSSGTTGDSTTGGDTDSTSTQGEESTTASVGPLEVGDDCNADNECMTGVCWDFSDYDPACFGAVCSVECENNEDCVQAFTDAGSPDPDGAICGVDGRCAGLGSGFGAFACAGPG